MSNLTLVLCLSVLHVLKVKSLLNLRLMRSAADSWRLLGTGGLKRALTSSGSKDTEDTLRLAFKTGLAKEMASSKSRCTEGVGLEEEEEPEEEDAEESESPSLPRRGP